MISKTLTLCVAMWSFGVTAADMATSPFTEALIEGEAQTPLPNDKNFAGLTELIQKKTGDTGEVVIKVVRILKFKTQPNCGRVAFIIMQPSKNIGWTDLGGQLNICTDGQPPLRECKETPGALYQPGHKCPSGKLATDTPEIAETIEAALKSGGLTHQQAKDRTFKAAEQKQGTGKVEK